MIFTPSRTVLVQGITTPLGQDCAERMKAYGMTVAAGTSVGAGGEKFQGIPIFNLVEEAKAQTGSLDIAALCLPAYAVLDAALEALACGLRQLIICSHGVPPLDMLRLVEQARRLDALVLGPGSAGVIVPEQMLVGAMEAGCYRPGNIGLLSRTDNLMDEVAWELSQADLGQSLAVNLGTAAIVGSSFAEWMPVFARDETTEAILIIDQDAKGSSLEIIEALSTVASKPVVAFLAGCHLPHPKLSHSESFVLADYLAQPALSSNRADAKATALKKAKVTVVPRLSQIPTAMKKVLRAKVNLS